MLLHLKVVVEPLVRPVRALTVCIVRQPADESTRQKGAAMALTTLTEHSLQRFAQLMHHGYTNTPNRLETVVVYAALLPRAGFR